MEMLIYSFPSFNETRLVTHAFTTRLGGLSSKPYNTLNMGLHVGDKVKDVLANRRLVAEALGFSPEDLVAAQQVHGEQIHVARDVDRGRGAFVFEEAIPETDGIITAVPGLPLMTNYADCVPVFFLDPVNKVVALAHGGWKGTVAMISHKTLSKMTETFGTKARDCLVGIGPSIGPCCYEVDERVALQFREAFGGTFTSIAKPRREAKWDLDLWQAHRSQLLEAGVPQSNITTAGLCTSCHKETFFSYRADQGQTGRMAAIIMLTP